MMNEEDLYRMEFLAPTKLIFGEGEISHISKHLTFAERILLVTDNQAAEKSGALEKIRITLKDLDLILYSKITSNPKSDEINEAVRLGREKESEAIMGIGGGSVMDAAKAIAACVPGGEPVEHFIRQGIPAPGSTLPIIAVPTTAGTGSEMSKGAIITDVEEKKKIGLRGEALFPRLAVVDPELTYSLPPSVTAETGFDILTHGIETLVSRKANPITILFSEYSIQTVVTHLPKVLKNGMDVEARRKLMLASTLGGINLANSTTCLPHRMQYPLGAHTNCSHARGLASLYPAWCRATFPHALEQFAQIAAVLPGPPFDKKTSTEEKAHSITERIESFMKTIGVYHRMRDFGLPKGMCSQLADEIEGDLTMDPGDTSKEIILKMYQDSW
jgi:alcohol dehydrogenase class IV